MKVFQFQQFAIKQSRQVFRVGTDGVLLGALTHCSAARRILEVGTGTGLIALMLAQRNPQAEILAIDINPAAAELAEQNFESSPFQKRLHAKLADYTVFPEDQKFDCIISNPPYFEENASEKDKIARQKSTLNFNHLLQKTARLLSASGALTVILPSEASPEFITLASDESLFLKKKINIYGIKGGKLKRNILEFTFTQSEPTCIDFYIEDSPRKYSAQYLELTQDFHVFRS